jgi:hypothetical protein
MNHHIAAPLSATQLEKVLADLAAAESWESMALRSTGRVQRHRGNPVRTPIAR